MDPLTQTRQLMSYHSPEHRPFALQEIVRAARFSGGAQSESKGTKRPETSYSALHVPAWLDIFLYITVTFVLGSAFFMILYSLYITPYTVVPESANPSERNDGSVRSVRQNVIAPPSVAEENAEPIRNLRTPPHPPPPPVDL